MLRKTWSKSPITSAPATLPPLQRARTAILNSLQTIVLFPRVGRLQDVAGVRKHVTPKYSYLVYYSLDEASDEIVILTIQHRAREREFSDL